MVGRKSQRMGVNARWTLNLYNLYILKRENMAEPPSISGGLSISKDIASCKLSLKVLTKIPNRLEKLLKLKTRARNFIAINSIIFEEKGYLSHEKIFTTHATDLELLPRK